jgi:hypothetical protein
LEESLAKEKHFAHQATIREKELADQYTASVASERAAAQAQIQQALDVADERQKALDAAYEDKRKALEAQIQEQDKILTVQWMQKEAETIEQLNQHYKKKEADLQDKLKKQLEAEISRQTHLLEERTTREMALRHEELER